MVPGKTGGTGLVVTGVGNRSDRFGNPVRPVLVLKPVFAKFLMLWEKRKGGVWLAHALCQGESAYGQGELPFLWLCRVLDVL